MKYKNTWKLDVENREVLLNAIGSEVGMEVGWSLDHRLEGKCDRKILFVQIRPLGSTLICSLTPWGNPIKRYVLPFFTLGITEAQQGPSTSPGNTAHILQKKPVCKVISTWCRPFSSACTAPSPEEGPEMLVTAEPVLLLSHCHLSFEMLRFHLVKQGWCSECGGSRASALGMDWVRPTCCVRDGGGLQAS